MREEIDQGMTETKDQTVCGDVALTPEQKRAYLRFGIQQLKRAQTPEVKPEPFRLREYKPRVATDLSKGCSPLRVYTNVLLREFIGHTCTDGTSVLDVGCGAGEHAMVFEESGEKISYLGVDAVRHEAWSDLDRRPWANIDCAFRQCDAATIDRELATSAFDITMTSSALEHFPEDAAAVRSIFNVTGSRGMGIHIVPAPFSLFLYGFHGWRRYPPDRLVNIFKASGFDVERLYSLGGLPSYILHLVWISWLETGLIYEFATCKCLPEAWRERLTRLRFTGLRRNRVCLKIYAALAGLALRLDRWLPWPAHGYAIVARRPVEDGQAVKA